jgi:regulatory protein
VAIARRRPPPAEWGDAYAYALTLLAGRAYPVEELRQRLVRHGHTVADIDSAIERLTNVSLIDDRAFSVQFARSRILGGSTAPRRVRQELARRGVPPGIAEAAIADVLADERIDLTESIEQLARRRAAVLAGVEPSVRRRRLYAYLARRGYDADAVARAVASVEAAEPARSRRQERRTERPEE